MEEKEDIGNFLSNLVYQNPIKRRLFLNNSKYKHFMLTEFNDSEYAVVLDSYNNKAYHLHRGTVNKDDIKTDFHLSIGNFKNTERYNNTKSKVNKSSIIFHNFEHFHVGHSLGGTLAQEIAIEKKHNSISINRGSSPLEKSVNLDKNKHVHFRDENDLVSKFTKDNVTVSKKRRKNDFIENSHLKFTMPIFHKIYTTYKAHLLN